MDARRRRYANNSGGIDDIAELRRALGGPSVLPALFDVRRNVTAPANVMSSWVEVERRSAVPTLTAAGATKPTWDPTTLLITGGTDGTLASASADALYDFTQIRSLFAIGVIAANSLNKTLACITEGVAENRAIEINGNSGIATFIGGQTIASGVALSTSRRLIFASHNGSTTGRIQVPDQAAVTHAITALASGSNFLTVFNAIAAGGFEALGPIRALGCLTRQETAADVALIRRWAIAAHAAVPA